MIFDYIAHAITLETNIKFNVSGFPPKIIIEKKTVFKISRLNSIKFCFCQQQLS